MAVTGGDPTRGSAPRPRQRFGPDLGPRVAAAVAMGCVALAAAWIGGFVFAAFWWIAAIVVLWEWQRLIGAARLVERVAVGGARACAALRCRPCTIGSSASRRRSFSARPRSAGSPARSDAVWAAAGVLYAGALVASLGLSAGEPQLRPGGDSVALRGRLGSGHRGLFRRPADRRPAALAERFAGQDLVRGDRRRVRRGRPRPRSLCAAGRTASPRCSGSGSRRRLSPSLATSSNPRSSGVSASRIRAASFPATAD